MKTSEIIKKFESQCKMRTVDRIYDCNDEWIIETSTSMARKNLDPFFIVKKDSFSIEHVGILDDEEFPEEWFQNMIYESKEVLERENKRAQYQDEFVDELIRRIEEEYELP